MITVPDKVKLLLAKGVKMPHPLSVDIGEGVDVDKISTEGVVFHRGTRIDGTRTVICRDVALGEEAPVTVDDCRLGSGVRLKGGFFKGSVFLQKTEMASGAHVRDGCILEEEAKGGHTVGLKQTILFPFVTLGSLINFCDCFMAGGTDRRNHSEVGSSYIHFNYTPHQDKATPSLIGDVPRGVMLNQPPIFLGGQGGLVGPVRIGYGTVIAAGTIWRRDCADEGKLLSGQVERNEESEYHPGFYGDIRRRVSNNIRYIANLLALRQWYIHVRSTFVAHDRLDADLFRGARETVETAILERLRQLENLSAKMGESIALGERILAGSRRDAILRRKREFSEKWPELRHCLTEGHESGIALRDRDAFLEIVDRGKSAGTDYIPFIRNLDGAEAALGTRWLEAIVEETIGEALTALPSWNM